MKLMAFTLRARLWARQSAQGLRVLVVAIFLLSILASPSRALISWFGSTYSSLDPKDCRPLRQDPDDPVAGPAMNCAGVAGFRLLVYYNDDRASITVVAPDGKEFPLDYWAVVTRHFSSLGAKAEWRVGHDRGVEIPIALIVRVKYSEMTNGYKPKERSVLALAEITPAEVCVVQIIKDSPKANDEARDASLGASAKPCLKPLP